VILYTDNKTHTPFEIDDADYDMVSQYRWAYRKCGTGGHHYIYRMGGGKEIPLHRILLSVRSGYMVDHRDGNTCNNKRANLRECTKITNARNAKRASNNTSGYKGVSWNKGKNKWKAYINYGGRQIFLGYYDKVLDAYGAYCQAGHELFGEFFRPE